MSDITRREAIKAASVVPMMGCLGVRGTTHPHADTDITVSIRNWFVNRCPLLTRLPWVPVDADEFTGISVTQHIQGFQFPVQSNQPYGTHPCQILDTGIPSPFDFNMTMQLQNLVDSAEFSICYGRFVIGRDPRMHGLRELIQTNRRRVTPRESEMAWSSDYEFDEFRHDLIERPSNSGGMPDVLLIASNLVEWINHQDAPPLWKVPAGKTMFGTDVKVMEHRLLPNITIIEAPLLLPYNAISLTSSEVCIRNKVNPQWKTRNDDHDGEWIAELAIELINEQHHAFIS